MRVPTGNQPLPPAWCQHRASLSGPSPPLILEDSTREAFRGRMLTPLSDLGTAHILFSRRGCVSSRHRCHRLSLG